MHIFRELETLEAKAKQLYNENKINEEDLNCLETIAKWIREDTEAFRSNLIQLIDSHYADKDNRSK
jgi:hypothetical protein